MEHIDFPYVTTNHMFSQLDARAPMIHLTYHTILRILELMPIKYVARTSTLSKHWRHIWSTQSHLVFDTLFFIMYLMLVLLLASVIHKILMKHAGNILGFHLISETYTLT
ncbi:hypothetical protein H5410_026003 [Solanum commersonii]|uniref:F-box domain-containing protein n=1 Tax=Solanum commersonii TaxID=4109 RepID=A0A9J5YXP0_SOLCO|nr:hypothetical protein H5410_026003 [Solanum commersonii]